MICLDHRNEDFLLICWCIGITLNSTTMVHHSIILIRDMKHVIKIDLMEND